MVQVIYSNEILTGMAENEDKQAVSTENSAVDLNEDVIKPILTG
jgi:hypothetical protein